MGDQMIYAPSSITSYSGGVGKDVPAMGPFKSYSPRLLSGGGRFAGIIQAGYTVGRHFYKNRKFYTRAGAVVTGAGVKYASSNNKQQTLRAVHKRFNNNGYRKRYGVRQRNSQRCCCCNHS